MLLAALPLKAIGVVSAVYLHVAAPSTDDLRPRVVDAAPLATDPSTPVPSVTSEPVLVMLYDVNHDESATVVIHRDGHVDDANDQEIRRLFRCRRTGKQRAMSRDLLRLIADIQARYPGKTLEFVSGYRGHREESKTSPHRAGRALDLRVRGGRITELRDYLWRTHRSVGVGYYPSEGFVHIDSRDKEITWTEKNGVNQYNPSWADRARRDKGDRSARRAKREKRPNA